MKRRAEQKALPKRKRAKTSEQAEEEKAPAEGSRRSGRIAKQDDVDYTLFEEEKDVPGRFQGVMLAGKYEGKEDINGWLMSEKLDGVRCVWTGKAMYTRNGNAFYPPDYFTEGLPKDTVLDGELFLGRGKFPETMSIVRKHQAHDGWKEIKYLIFDGPEMKGGFRHRLKKLKEVLDGCDNPYVQLHEHQTVNDKAQLDAELKKVTDKDGEGLMLREPNQKYEYRRVDTMLKVKVFHDEEAVVIGKERGTGRCATMMGALVCKDKKGIEFKVGSGFTDAQRRNPPKKGTQITFRYFEKTKSGKPRFPTFMREYTPL